jgi:hypothetical protein
MRPLSFPIAAAALLTLASGCAAPATVSFRVESNVKDAMVTVDDQLLGTVAYVEKRGVAMPPGIHRVTVEKAGYFPFDKEVVAREGDATLKLEVPLEKVPD